MGRADRMRTKSRGTSDDGAAILLNHDASRRRNHQRVNAARRRFRVGVGELGEGGGHTAPRRRGARRARRGEQEARRRDRRGAATTMLPESAEATPRARDEGARAAGYRAPADLPVSEAEAVAGAVHEARTTIAGTRRGGPQDRAPPQPRVEDADRKDEPGACASATAAALEDEARRAARREPTPRPAPTSAAVHRSRRRAGGRSPTRPCGPRPSATRSTRSRPSPRRAPGDRPFFGGGASRARRCRCRGRPRARGRRGGDAHRDGARRKRVKHLAVPGHPRLRRGSRRRVAMSFRRSPSPAAEAEPTAPRRGDRALRRRRPSVEIAASARRRTFFCSATKSPTQFVPGAPRIPADGRVVPQAAARRRKRQRAKRLDARASESTDDAEAARGEPAPARCGQRMRFSPMIDVRKASAGTTKPPRRASQPSGASAENAPEGGRRNDEPRCRRRRQSREKEEKERPQTTAEGPGDGDERERRRRRRRRRAGPGEGTLPSGEGEDGEGEGPGKKEREQEEKEKAAKERALAEGTREGGEGEGSKERRGGVPERRRPCGEAGGGEKALAEKAAIEEKASRGERRDGGCFQALAEISLAAETANREAERSRRGEGRNGAGQGSGGSSGRAPSESKPSATFFFDAGPRRVKSSPRA